MQANQTSILRKKNGNRGEAGVEALLGFVAASANELTPRPLLGFLVKATRANLSAPFLFDLLAIAHSLGD